MKRYILCPLLMAGLLMAQSTAKHPQTPEREKKTTPTAQRRYGSPAGSRFTPERRIRSEWGNRNWSPGGILANSLSGMFSGTAIGLGAYIYNKQLIEESRQSEIWGNSPSGEDQANEPRDLPSFASIPPPPMPDPTPLAPPYARFSSEPSGAEVRVDGEYVGTTPTAETFVAPGPHVVTMTRTGYQRWSGSLSSSPGNIDAIRGELKLDGDPTKSKIAGL